MHRITLASYPNQELRAVVHRMKAPRPLPEPDWDPESGPDPLTLTLGSNSEPPLEAPEIVPGKPGFGVLGRLTKFGNNARRTIMRCGGALDQTVERDRVIMLTGTLPGGTDEAFKAIAQWSSYLVDRLKSWLSKHWKPQYSFYVWELQKRGALHIHYCVHVPGWDEGEALIRQWHSEWYRLLCNVCDRTGIDLFQRADGGSWRAYPSMLQAHAQRIQRSAVAYMAKYCGKNSGKTGPGTGTPRYAPVRWWGCSRPLLALLESLTQRFEKVFTKAPFAHRIFKILAGNLDSFSAKCHNYRDRATDAEVCVAYQSHLQPEELWKMSTQEHSQTSSVRLNMTMTMGQFGSILLTQILCGGSMSPSQLMEESGVRLRMPGALSTNSGRLERLAHLRAMSDFAYASLLTYRSRGDRSREILKAAQRLNTWLLMAWEAESQGLPWWTVTVQTIWDRSEYNSGVPRASVDSDPPIAVSQIQEGYALGPNDPRMNPETWGRREAHIQLAILNMHMANEDG